MLISQSAFAYNCTSLPTWQSASVYVGGNQVQFNQNAYKANWWTLGKNPENYSDKWQEWTLLGKCDSGGTAPANQLPVANPNGPYSGTVQKAIAFSSLGTSDPDGNIASYSWKFGDGKTSTEASPTYTYQTAGSFIVTLTVTDNKGATATRTTTASITAGGGDSACDAPQYKAGTKYAAGEFVQNMGTKYQCEIAGWCSSTSSMYYEPGKGLAWNSAWKQADACDASTAPVNKPPVANANGPYTGLIHTNIAFNSRGSTDSDGSISKFFWEFGDGKTSTMASPTHTYVTAGTYNITLSVTDNAGATTKAAAVATITNPAVNTAPTAKANGPYTGKPGLNVVFSSAGSTDPDGSIQQYLWNFGDGTTSTQANPTHAYAKAGSYAVTLTVTDQLGAKGTSATKAEVSAIDTPPSTGAKKVVGYFTAWGVYGRNYHVKDIVTSGSANHLTHILYAFGNVRDGQCKIGDAFADYDKAYTAAQSVDGVADTWETGSLRGNFGQLRKLKKMYPNIKIIWSFGGWTWSGGFGQAAQNPTAFANSCYNLVFDPRWADVFDGIDIDWEYPNECGLTCDTSGFEAYKNLMKALREKFGSNRLITSAIGAGESKLKAANYGGAAQYVDFYALMTYDFFGAWNAKGPTAPHSPLYNYSGIPVNNFQSDNAVQVLKSLGVPAEKILLGIGFYGRGWTGVTQAAPGGTATGPAAGTYESGIEDYKVLKTKCPTTGVIAGTAYAHCGNNWWSYDTPATIKGKMDYTKQQSLGGAFFWELSGDTSNGELINAIGSGLK